MPKETPGDTRSMQVDYDVLDRFKREALEAARSTSHNVDHLDISVVPETLGESATVYQLGHAGDWLADVNEGLGTKNLVADALSRLRLIGDMRSMIRESHYAAIARDTVAMIVNDLATIGARPVSVKMHLAVGSSAWFNDEQRWRDLIDGWRDACNAIGAAWTGGETPELRGIIEPQHALLSGSAFGIFHWPNKPICLGEPLPGDAIVVFASSGIHANGLTAARKIAKRLPESFRTPTGITDGNAQPLNYAEALLVPTILYTPVINALLETRVPIHYATNITGHGWRKLMRHPKPMTYVIEALPPVPPIFSFMRKYAPEITDQEAYEMWNMGAGFAVYVSEKDVSHITDIARQHGIQSYQVGYVETHSPKSSVVMRPLNNMILGSLDIR